MKIKDKNDRNLLFTASLTLFTLTIGVGIISPILPVIASDMGAGGVLIGLIFSAFSISRLIFLPIFGKLSDRFGRRLFVLTGLFLYSLLAILYAFARTPEDLIAVRVFHGVSSAMVMPVILAMVAEFSPPGKEGMYMGIANRSIFLGMAFGPFIGGVISDIYSESHAFFSMAFLSLVTLVIASLTVDDKRAPEVKKRQKDGLGRRVLIALIYRILNSVGRGSIMTFLPVYGYLIGLSYAQIGFLVFINLLISGIIQPFGGVISDKRGFVAPVLLSSILSSFLLYLIPLTPEFLMLTLISAFLGLTSAFSLPALSGLVAYEGKLRGNVGSIMGYFSASKSLGRAAGPVIAGIVYDAGGQGMNGIYFAFTAASALTFLAGILFWIGIRDSDHVVEIE